MSSLTTLFFYSITLFCLILVACSPTGTISQNEPISIRLNQKRVNLEKEIRLSRVQAVSEPYLSLEENDSNLVDNLAKSDNLQIILARGSRPVTAFQTSYDLPYRMGFRTDPLFDQAEAGDRLIFLADEDMLYTLPIVR